MGVKEFVNHFKNNIALYSLASYALGLFYNYAFYMYFKIPIQYYLSIPDMLLFSVTNLFFIVLICALYEAFFLDYLGHYLESLSSSNDKSRLKIYSNFTFGFTTISACIFIILSVLIHVDKDYLFIYFGFCIAINARILFLEDRKEKFKHLTLKKIFIIVLLTLFSSYLTAFFYEQNLNKQKISFNYSDGKIFSNQQNKDSIFIGETTSHIFLYDKPHKSSIIFSKSELKRITYSK